MTIYSNVLAVQATLKAATVAARGPVRVRLVVWVTLRACLDYRTGSGYIHSVGDCFQMLWIATQSDTTQMIYSESFGRPVPVCQLICESVRQNNFALAFDSRNPDVEPAVALRDLPAGPNLTVIREPMLLSAMRGNGLTLESFL
jgi:hypothetical protein